MTCAAALAPTVDTDTGLDLETLPPRPGLTLHPEPIALGPALPRARPRVVLAEDDVEMRVMLSLLLRHEGYLVKECANGPELLEELGTALEAGEPPAVDLIVSDIRMPGISGLSIMEGLQYWHGMPPIIAITAFGDAETHERAERAGVAGMFDKPFEVSDFLATVHRLVPPPYLR